MIATHMEFMATLSRTRLQVIAQDLEPHPSPEPRHASPIAAPANVSIAWG